MSIYGTSWTIKVEIEWNSWREVFCQVVPGHIDDTGEKWDWLPPPSSDPDTPRAVVIVDALHHNKGTKRNGQEYHTPLMILSWAEYRAMTFDDMLETIETNIGRVDGECPDGEHK